MINLIFSAVFLIEVFALANRGGGPLLSHLFLTGITFLLVMAAFFRSRELHPKLRFAEVSFIVFFLFFAVSLLFAVTPGYGLAEFLLFANGFMLFSLISWSSISEKQLRFFTDALIALAAAVTLIGFFIYTRTSFPRLAGTFIDLEQPYTSFANDFGNFLLLILPLAAWRLSQRHQRKSTTALHTLATGVLLTGLVLCFSRGAWISAFVLIVIIVGWWIFYRRPIPKEVFIRAFAAVLVTVLCVNALQLVRSQQFETTRLLQKVGFQADEGTASAVERVAFFKGAVRIIADRPFLGAGVLGFRFLFPQYQQKFGINWDHPHNIFLKIGVENGLIALVFFFIFLLAVGIRGLRFFAHHPWHASFPLALGALGSLGHNLIDVNYIVANFTLFMVFLGIVRASARGEEAWYPQRGWPLSALAIWSVMLLLLGLHEGWYNIDFKRGRAALAAGEVDQAVAQLERTQKLFFDRDVSQFLAEAYGKKYEATKAPEWKEKAISLLEHEVLRSHDAAVFARLGNWYMKDEKFAEAEAQFRQAIALDPQNQLAYYYKFFDAARKQGKPDDEAVKNRTLELLNEAAGVIKYNRHITVLSDNPLYASKLYGLFGMTEAQEEFDALWWDELLKFTLKYGAPPARAGL